MEGGNINTQNFTWSLITDQPILILLLWKKTLAVRVPFPTSSLPLQLSVTHRRLHSCARLFTSPIFISPFSFSARRSTARCFASHHSQLRSSPLRTFSGFSSVLLTENANWVWVRVVGLSFIKRKHSTTANLGLRKGGKKCLSLFMFRILVWPDAREECICCNFILLRPVLLTSANSLSLILFASAFLLLPSYLLF